MRRLGKKFKFLMQKVGGLSLILFWYDNQCVMKGLIALGLLVVANFYSA